MLHCSNIQNSLSRLSLRLKKGFLKALQKFSHQYRSQEGTENFFPLESDGNCLLQLLKLQSRVTI